MATDSALLSPEGQFGVVDMIIAWVFPLATVTLVGIGSFTVLGFDLSTVIWSASGIEVSYAWIAVVTGLLAAWVTNRAGQGWDDLDPVESVAVAGGLLLVVGMVAIPAISDLVLGTRMYGVAAGMVLTGAFMVIGYY